MTEITEPNAEHLARLEVHLEDKLYGSGSSEREEPPEWHPRIWFWFFFSY